MQLKVSSPYCLKGKWDDDNDKDQIEGTDMPSIFLTTLPLLSFYQEVLLLPHPTQSHLEVGNHYISRPAQQAPPYTSLALT